jgi:hypothetical protein
MDGIPEETSMTDELARELLRELKSIKALLEPKPRLRKVKVEETTRQLALAIISSAGTDIFTARELVAHARLEEEVVLREAIVAELGTLSGRRVGKFLKRIEGLGFAGHAVQRSADSNQGALWVVSKLPETPVARLVMA